MSRSLGRVAYVHFLETMIVTLFHSSLLWHSHPAHTIALVGRLGCDAGYCHAVCLAGTARLAAHPCTRGQYQRPKADKGLRKRLASSASCLTRPERRPRPDLPLMYRTDPRPGGRERCTMHESNGSSIALGIPSRCQPRRACDYCHQLYAERDCEVTSGQFHFPIVLPAQTLIADSPSPPRTHVRRTQLSAGSIGNVQTDTWVAITASV